MTVRRGTPLYLTARQMLQAGMTWDDAHQTLGSEVVVAALEKSRGNVCRAALLLSMHRNTLTRQLAIHGLNKLAKELRSASKKQRKIIFPSLAICEA